MTARVDPIPQEAREFQGRRAGLVTRAAAACIDIAVVALALVVAYLGFVVVLFLVPPGGLQLPVPPLWLDLVASTVVLTLYLAVSWHEVAARTEISSWVCGSWTVGPGTRVG